MRTLRRSPDNRVLGGVCGAVSRATGIDATIVRIGFVLLSIASGVLANRPTTKEGLNAELKPPGTGPCPSSAGNARRAGKPGQDAGGHAAHQLGRRLSPD